MGPPWQACERESRELLYMCLKKIPGLSKVKLIDAAWVWTEPHSRRLKIKLTIQKEVMASTILQQSLVVDFAERNQQCPECQASYAQGMWKSLVHVRQRVPHKRTFLHLEQLILKHGAHTDCLSLEVTSVACFSDPSDKLMTHYISPFSAGVPKWYGLLFCRAKPSS